MAEPDIRCRQCGKKLTKARMVTETFLTLPGENEIGAQQHQRTFEGVCPEHGNRLVSLTNEGHSTLLEVELKKSISKAEAKELRKILPADDRKRFRKAARGQYLFSEDDINNWRKFLGGHTHPEKD